MPPQPHRQWRSFSLQRLTQHLTNISITLAALLLLYVGSYFALATHGGGSGGLTTMVWVADYSPLPPAYWRVFDPIHRVDRALIRRSYWGENRRIEGLVD